MRGISTTKAFVTKCIKGITRLFILEEISLIYHLAERASFSNSDLNSIALKAFMVLTSVILQKQSATLKRKEHSEVIERRVALC